MKILFVAPAALNYPSGVSAYVLELARSLLKEGYREIGLLSVFPIQRLCGELADIFVMAGPKTYHWNPWFVNTSWIKRIENEFGRPDLVHFHDVYYPFQNALAIQMYRKGWKYIFSPHGGLQESQQRRKLIKKILGNIFFFDSFLNKCEAVHVLNEAENLSFKKRFPHVKTFCVPNGVPADVLSMIDGFSCRTAIFPRKTFLRFGFIGRIDVYAKGIDLLLEAVKLLQMKYPRMLAEFVFVGPFRTNKDRSIFNNLVSSLDDPGKIKYEGLRVGKDKWDILSTFDVFVHTSRYEGMPGAVIEAMAFEKPCLVTPGTNMQDIIQECRSGWVVKADAQAIADGLKAIIQSSRQEFFERGCNGREYVKKHLTWDLIVHDYVRQICCLAK